MKKSESTWTPWSIRSGSITKQELSALSNKTVPFQFYGHRMKLALSMGLFSSNDVDSGTRLLLKTLAKQTDLSRFRSIADIGCGVGTIGLALKKHLSESRVILRDRDALAVDYSRWNGELNGIRADAVEQELMLCGLDESSLDLLVTNIPAKAGEKVMDDFFMRSPNYLTEEGLAALVIVSPLREEAERLMGEHDLDVTYAEHTKMHSVYHFRRPGKRGVDEGLAPYIRHRSDYELEGRSYELDTVYNVPDFDMVGWKHRLAARLLKPHAKSGHWCFWNPGQGHLAAWFHGKCRPPADRIILSGRDLLQCRITEHNLRKNGYTGEILLKSSSTFPALEKKLDPGSLDLFVADLSDLITRTDWHTPLKEAGKAVLKKGGLLLIYGRSSDIHQFMRGGNRGYSPLSDDRNRGNRCVILKKN